MKKISFFLIFWFFGYHCNDGFVLPEAIIQEAEADRKYDLRQHLRDIVDQAFADALNSDSIDHYSINQIAMSDEKILLLGEQIYGENVSKYCASLMGKQFEGIPEDWRSAVWFQPVKEIAAPVVNLTMHLPKQWFKQPGYKKPLVYVCYGGKDFIKLDFILNTRWLSRGSFRTGQIHSEWADKGAITGILVVLDDVWNNRNLLPKQLDARAFIETNMVRKRKVFDKECDVELGINQTCCLWKFNVTDEDGPKEFHRCFGDIPNADVKSELLSEELAELLTRGGMTRRFLTARERVCRGIEYRPMAIRMPDGVVKNLNKLDAVKCGAFF